MTIQITQEMFVQMDKVATHGRAEALVGLLDLIERAYYCRPRAHKIPPTGRERGGRMFEDPGPNAICRRCSFERSRHGGAKALGICPSQVGTTGGRFRLRDEDKRWKATTPTSESA